MISAMSKKEERSPWEGVDVKYSPTAVCPARMFLFWLMAFLTLEQARPAEAP